MDTYELSIDDARQVRNTYRSLQIKRGKINQNHSKLLDQIERQVDIEDKLRIVGLQFDNDKSVEYNLPRIRKQS